MTARKTLSALGSVLVGSPFPDRIETTGADRTPPGFGGDDALTGRFGGPPLPGAAEQGALPARGLPTALPEGAAAAGACICGDNRRLSPGT